MYSILLKKENRLGKFSPAEKFIIQKLEEELPANLTYHGFHHTINVLHAAWKLLPQKTCLKKI